MYNVFIHSFTRLHCFVAADCHFKHVHESYNIDIWIATVTEYTAQFSLHQLTSYGIIELCITILAILYIH